ncbi:MAG: putative ABC transporter permease [Spirochaetaceae bacterium]|jgi:uncharacterized membrane protein|nr:putative ABC transporter permease [Spirochaetaceae bacterium]
MDAVKEYIFAFFCLGCTGWVLETVQETIVRKKFVNKGFFKGPFTPSHGIGGLGVYLLGSPFRAHPPLVFLTGLAVCTLVEYVMALFLERCFRVKCWDYTTYPHTRWCHFQGRICLTISLFFGLITLFVVYVYWDLIMSAAARIGKYLLPLDITLVTLFLADIVVSCAGVLRANKAGIKLKGYALFSDVTEIE